MVPQFIVNYFVVLALVLLRVGVPLALAIAVGRWLERKLRPQDAKEMEGRKGARIIQFPGLKSASGMMREAHCWDVKECDPAVRAECPAYRRPELPCWLAAQAAEGKFRDKCSTCDLYRRRHAMA
jgi:hypothetical protein